VTPVASVIGTFPSVEVRHGTAWSGGGVIRPEPRAAVASVGTAPEPARQSDNSSGRDSGGRDSIGPDGIGPDSIERDSTAGT